jgi:hypothetical protein
MRLGKMMIDYWLLDTLFVHGYYPGQLFTLRVKHLTSTQT